MSRQLWKEDIDKYTDSTGCIPESAKAYINMDGRIDMNEWYRNHPSDFGEFVRTVQTCDSNNFENGCCITDNEDTTCKNENNITDNKHDVGLKFLNGDRGTASLCHKEKVQNLYNNLFDDPNKIIKFFKLIVFSIIGLLISALIGACYEFWFRYGNAVDCLYYKSKCANIGETDRINIVNYMFPRNLCYYPYQSCGRLEQEQRGGNKTLKGGKKQFGIISTFAEYEHAGAKCINMGFDSIISGQKPIPYNVADFALLNFKSVWLQTIAKAISFYFLFTIIVVRKVFNWIFNTISGRFQRIFKFNPTLNNLNFLILTGLFFPILGYYTGYWVFYGGPLTYLSIFTALSSLICSFGFFISFICTCFPKAFFGVSLDRCNIPSEYYRIPTWRLFYSLEGLSIPKKILTILLNILLIIPTLIVLICALIFGSIMSALAGAWFNLSFYFHIFYIPLTNPLELLSILKSHADLLTILFCIGVIGSSANSLDTTTTSVMSIILVIIMVIKIFVGLKHSV